MILEEELLAIQRKQDLLEFIQVFPCNLNWQIDVGSVFVIETNILPLYGVVFRVSQNESKRLVEFAYLTLHLGLASVEAPILAIGDDVFTFAKLTHITRIVDFKNLSAASRPLRPVADVNSLLQWIEKLGSTSYGWVHQKFFDLESQFVDYVLEYVGNLNKIITIPANLRAILDKEFETVLAASSVTKVARFDKVFLVSSKVGAKLYFDDILSEKIGRILIKGVVVYEGPLNNGIVLLHFNRYLPLLKTNDLVVELAQ